ncbi:MAG: rane protein DedA, SNARE-associated domain [Dehalococcoidia bacterium]|nr:rane protein DedA, SNARE-associated domain [Dehalococcoidia bacterium]
MEALMEAVFAFVRAVYDSMGWPGVVLLMAVESAAIPLPSEVIMPLSGWMLIKEQDLGAAFTLLAGVYGALGCVLGSAVSYWLGLKGGQPLVEKYGRYFLVTQHDIELANTWFVRYGNAAIFYSRLLPVARTYVSLAAGIARMPFKWFLPLTFLGSFPWCLGLAYAGFLLGSSWNKIHTVLGPFSYTVLLLAVIGIAYYFYVHIKHYQKWKKLR